jgi:hypothetical protein
MRIMPEFLLHQHRQAIEAFAHIGVPGRKPHPNAGWETDHRCRTPRASAVIAATTAAASIGPPIRSRAPLANSTSITVAAGLCPCAIATDANFGSLASLRRVKWTVEEQESQSNAGMMPKIDV